MHLLLDLANIISGRKSNSSNWRWIIHSLTHSLTKKWLRIKNCRVEMMLIRCGNKITFRSFSLTPPKRSGRGEWEWTSGLWVWAWSPQFLQKRCVDQFATPFIYLHWVQNYSFRSCLLPIIPSRGRHAVKPVNPRYRRRLLAVVVAIFIALCSVQIN